MKSLNRITLIGYVGKDAEVRYTSGGTAVGEFSMATSEKWKDKQTGEDKERTEWHTVAAWAKLGELVGEYVKKGMPVYVEGTLRTETWEKDGQKHYRTKVQAQNIIFLGSQGEKNAKPAKAQAAAQPGKQSAAPAVDAKSTAVDDPFGDDIPFGFLLPAALSCAYAAENVFSMFQGLVA